MSDWLADRAAVIDVTHRYCWALDTRSWTLLDEVFLPDATAELASPPLADRAAIVARVQRALLPLDATQHTVTNHMVEVAGDHATCTSYLHAQHVRAAAEGGSLYVVAGRYHDRLVRTAEGWRIAHRRLEIVWTDGNIAVVAPPRQG